jgi:15-cis-phytoene synthase
MGARNTNFYYSFLALPPEKREAIVAVWDFCRAVDDVADEPAAASRADEPGGGPAAQLQHWRDEVAACFEGGRPRSEQGRRLKPHVARFSLPRRAFDAVIDGVEMDLVNSRYPTFEALREYCLRVASEVGLICLEIFGYRDPRAREYAVDLGIALQLTNIIRDVAGDLARGRVYLPQEDLARFHCTEEDLRAGIVTENVSALMKHECGRAREYYAKANREFPRADRRRLVAARIMGAIYFDILRRIERLRYDVFSRIVCAPPSSRAMIAASTWARTMVGL